MTSLSNYNKVASSSTKVYLLPKKICGTIMHCKVLPANVEAVTSLLASYTTDGVISLTAE